MITSAIRPLRAFALTVVLAGLGGFGGVAPIASAAEMPITAVAATPYDADGASKGNDHQQPVDSLAALQHYLRSREGKDLVGKEDARAAAELISQLMHGKRSAQAPTVTWEDVATLFGKLQRPLFVINAKGAVIWAPNFCDPAKPSWWNVDCVSSTTSRVS